jgi:hypothetical protein
VKSLADVIDATTAAGGVKPLWGCISACRPQHRLLLARVAGLPLAVGQGASSAVAEFGGRGISYPKQQRDRGKAEIFELALARVSRELAAAANRTAAQLRAERIAAAQSTESGPDASTRSMRRVDQPRLEASKRAQATKTTGGLKKDASSRAAGARRQAKRDAR